MAHVKIEYTPSHTGKKTVEARANEAADRKAAKAHSLNGKICMAFLPSFAMDEFALHSERLGWIETGTQEVIEHEWNRDAMKELEKKPRMATQLYDGIPHPPYPYTRAISAFSATVQLYIRSGQIPVKGIVAERSNSSDDLCTYGCQEKETIHHLMVECPKFENWRVNIEQKLIQKAREEETKEDWPTEYKGEYIRLAESYLRDRDVWPLRITQFYLGHVPRTKRDKKEKGHNKKLAIKKAVKGMHDELHYAGIRLASRIYGHHLRIRAKETEWERY